jgi:hypothetical protein
MCLQLVINEDLDWIAKGNVQWRALVNFIIEFCFTRKARNLLKYRMIIILTRTSFQKKDKGKGRPRTGYEGPEG